MPKPPDSAPQAPTARGLLAEAAAAQRAGNRTLATELLFKAKALAATTGETLPRSVAYELGVLLGAPAEISKTFLVLRSGKLKPSEVTDIRPLAPEEIKRTPKQWSDAKVIFDSKGRI